MTIEQQCCTLLQAKRLKELGVEQISQFYWSDFADNKFHLFIRKELGLYGVECEYFSGLFFVRPGIESGLSAYSAYTVAELGIMLPDWLLRGDIDKDSEMGFAIGVWPTNNLKNNWGCRWQRSDQCEFHPSESIARTSLLIHLIENNIVTVEEINKRLHNS